MVNFKLRQRFQGAQLDAQVGESKYGDYRNANIGAIVGGNFADDRGNAYVSMSYTSRDPVLARDRPFYVSAMQRGVLPNGFPFIGYGYYKIDGSNAPSQAAVDAYFQSVSPNYAPGRVSALGGTNLGFNNDASSLFNTAAIVPGSTIYNFPGSPTLRQGIASYGAVVYNTTYDSDLSVGLQRWSAFGRGEYKVNDHVKAFAQFLYTDNTTKTQVLGDLTDNFWSPTIPYDATHPVPAALATILNSRANPTAPWSYGGYASYAGPQNQEENTKVSQFLVGLSGDIPGSDLNWEVTAQRGKTDIADRNTGGSILFSRLQELLSAPYYGQNYVSKVTGNKVCTSGILPFGEDNSATQLNNPNTGDVVVGGHTFSRTVSQDCLNYLAALTTNLTSLEQDVVEANVQGGLFQLPAGQMRFAAGADFRRNTFSFSPDTIFQPKADTSADIVTQFGQLATNGSTNVYEGYGELLIPLLKDMPFINRLEADVAARYSDYEQAGGVWAYKADGNWKVTEDFSFRGGYQRAVRAPNVSELFGPLNPGNGQGGPLATDPCVTNVALPYGNNSALNSNYQKVQSLCTALLARYGASYNGANYAGAGGGFNYLPGTYQGNPNLHPETADTFTFGAVFRPTWNLPLDTRVSLSMDYYNINLKGTISYLTPVQTYQLCFNANGASNPTYSATSPYCAAIVRAPGNGFPTNVASVFTNLGGTKTDGIDTQIDLASRVGPGALGINTVISYLRNFKQQTSPDAPFVQYVNTTDAASRTYFRWRANTDVSYTVGPGSIGLRWHFFGAIKDSSYATNPATTIQGVGAYSSFDLYGNYQVTRQLQLRAGIDNLFNRQPPSEGIGPNGVATGTTLPLYYDVLGRRYYAALRATF